MADKKWQKAEKLVAEDLTKKHRTMNGKPFQVILNPNQSDKTTKSDIIITGLSSPDRWGVSVKVANGAHLLDRVSQEKVHQFMADRNWNFPQLVDYLVWDGNISQASHHLPDMVASVKDNGEVEYFYRRDRNCFRYHFVVSTTRNTRKRVNGKKVEGDPAYTIHIVGIEEVWED